MTRTFGCNKRWLAVALVALLGCTSGSEPLASPAETGGLPLLGAGTHLGIWPTYEVLPTNVDDAVNARLAEAHAVGMSIARVHVSWAELETGAGQFDLSSLLVQLEKVTVDGLAVHVLIETLDSEGYRLPNDLVDPMDPYRLVDGRRLDDPVIMARFDALLAKVLPALAGHEVFAISIANEPDTYFDDYPPTTPEGLVFRDALVGFLTAGRARIHATMPLVAVAMTLRQGSLDMGFAAALAPVIAAGDVAVFNYYCQDGNFQVKPSSAVAGALDDMIAAARGRPIILQELGCPAGRAPSLVGASDAAQADFFATVFAEMATRPDIRAAFVFQAVDWSPELARSFTDPLREAGWLTLADQVEETLTTIGLIRYADGTTRPAWDEFISAIQGFQ